MGRHPHKGAGGGCTLRARGPGRGRGSDGPVGQVKFHETRTTSTDVVGVFPNPEALLRLAGAVLVEAHDERQATDRRCLGEATMALLNSPTPETVATPELMTA